MEVLTALVFWVIGLLILFLIIINAINASDMDQNIKEIRLLLQEIKETLKEQNVSSQNRAVPADEDFEDECPACHAKVALTDKVYPSCGLTLVLE